MFGIDVESVGQDGTDNSHGIKPGAAVNIHIGVLYIYQRVDIHFTSIVRALLACLTVFTGHTADGGRFIGNSNNILIVVERK